MFLHGAVFREDYVSSMGVRVCGCECVTELVHCTAVSWNGEREPEVAVGAVAFFVKCEASCTESWVGSSRVAIFFSASAQTDLCSLMDGFGFVFGQCK